MKSTNQLNVRDQGEISVSAFGTGSAGELQVTANSIQLDNQAQLLASTRSGEGGNITLNVQDILLLRRGSQISTTAGDNQFGGDGGNITIAAPKGFIVGVKSENSDITANAFTGSGGRVNITAQGIFGLQFRPRLTPFSDITASSTFGLSGTVILNTPDVDPNRGFLPLPTGLVDPSNKITQRCSRSSQRLENSFYIIGNGGLPERPGDPPLPSFPTGDVQAVAETTKAETLPSPLSSPSPPSSPPPIIEAQGWVRTTDGTIYLVAGGVGHMPTVGNAQWETCPEER